MTRPQSRCRTAAAALLLLAAHAWTPRLVTSLGYEGETGGQQYEDGSRLAARTEYQEIRFVNSYQITSSFQMLGELNHQFQNVGGFKQDFGVTLRALYTF
jgi:hypothetical protein